MSGALDIIYIRLTHGWLYLVAILDWFSRYVVSWQLDEILDIDFILVAVDDALCFTLLAVGRLAILRKVLIMKY